MAGFLAPPVRALIAAVLGAGVALSFMAATAPSGDSPKAQRSKGHWRVKPLAALGLLAAYVTSLWILRVRTHFLGDSEFWLSGLRGGSLPASPEALAQAVWLTASSLLRQMGASIVTLSLVSITCGVVFAILMWHLAREITKGQGEFICAFALLMTLGTSQLFYGYIESYPIVVVAILAYVLAGVRLARTGKGIVPLILTFTIAVVSHLVCLYLAPSFFFLIWRAQRSPTQRAVALLLGGVLPAALLLALGGGVQPWIHALDVVTKGATAAPSGADTRAYPLLSIDHAVDILNELTLVIPIPIMLFLAGAASPDAKTLRTNPVTVFLVLAAAFGIAGFVILVLPLAPAADWDLMSTLLLPSGVLGVWVGLLVYGRGERLMRVAAVTMGLASLLAFVLVNASADAGTRRYAVLSGPDARISPYARRHAYELLARDYRINRDYPHARFYTEQLLKLRPSETTYWAMMGETLMETGDRQGAIPYLLEALRRDPNRATTRSNLGICYSALRQYENALGEFQKAVALSPDRPDYRHNLGLALMNTGKPDSALAVWRQVILRWPGYGPTARALAKLDRRPE